jgi:hypothetical protein
MDLGLDSMYQNIFRCDCDYTEQKLHYPARGWLRERLALLCLLI